jgi:hypothetical protein
MVKVISFSLWGSDTKYTVGAIRNVYLANKYYPDFECWIYVHKDTVPLKIIESLNKNKNVKIIYKTGDIIKLKSRMWRYEPIDDPNVNVLLSRDTDTKIWEREVLAVREWLRSNKLFHIMRDHPLHTFPIMAGMFGTRKINNLNWSENINNYVVKHEYYYDQQFLNEIVYPLIKDEDNSVIHASFNKKEQHAIPFPIPYNKVYNFVGEYVFADGSRYDEHIKILKDSL